MKLAGWKTIIAGLGAMAAGGYMMSEGRSSEGLELVLLGAGLLGLADKGRRTEAKVDEIRTKIEGSTGG